MYVRGKHTFPPTYKVLDQRDQYKLNATEKASSILHLFIFSDTDHGSPGSMPHLLQFIELTFQDPFRISPLNHIYIYCYEPGVTRKK